MNTRSCLLTVGVSALLVTGSALTAAPASAAPGSAECVSAQMALRSELGVATVDINLANQLRAAISELEALSAQLEPLYLAAEQETQDELEALDAAAEAESLAWDRLEAARAASAAVDPDDSSAVDAAALELQNAQAAYEAAEAELGRADAAFLSAAEAAYTTVEIAALEARFDVAVVSFDDAFTRLGLTEGSDPNQLIALADAAVAACSAPAVVSTPVVRAAPAAPQKQRGLNIQTAAAQEEDATSAANLALLAGLAGFGSLAAAGTAVVVRRRSN